MNDTTDKMERDGQGKVVLTGTQFKVVATRDYHFDHGYSVTEAAREALNGMRGKTPEFVEWLSQGTLTLTDKGKVVDVEQGEPANA